jgi:hypothetical protein
MDVRMPDGTLVRNVPDNITQEDLLARYDAFKSDKRGNIINTDVPTVVGTTANPPVAEEPKRTMMDRVKALYEVPLTVASGAISGPVSSAYGVYKSATSPEFGTAQGTQVGQQAANEMARRMTYQPTSPVSQEILQDVSQMAEAVKLPPIIPTTGMIPSYARMASASQPVVRETATKAVPRMTEMLRKKPESTMSGVGSALTPEDTMRMQMAQQLRVPVPLSKGQATRDLAQQQFEIETAKNYPETVGKPLIKAQADRNDAILQNFDAFVDATGKQTFGLRATGKVVTDNLVKQAAEARKKINDAYTLAREKGETSQPLPYQPLKDYIDQQTPTVKSQLAPIIKAVEEEILRNDPKNTGQISINSLEDIYQFINKNYDPYTVGETHAKAMKNIINQITEGQGGDLYQNARKLRQDYAKRFENIGAVDRLLRTKTNSSDRVVAFEDVFQKSIINGTLDDVKNLGYALKKGGPEGVKAFNELKGQTIEYLKDQVTRSIDTDIYGNPVVSPAKFKSAVRELDQDGKLDYLFGKKGAQEIRDLMETTILVNAPLKGAANYSNTSSALIRSLNKLGSGFISKIPVIGPVTEYSFEKLQQRELGKKVKESINYSPSKMAEELKKGSKK